MVHFCCVSSCSNRSDRETGLSFHCLPLKRKRVLKQLIHVIGRKKLPLNKSTRVCSDHFPGSRGRMLRLDEVPSLNLPSLLIKTLAATPRRPPVRKTTCYEDTQQCSSSDSCIDADNTCIDDSSPRMVEMAVNTDLTMNDINELEQQLNKLELKHKDLECDYSKQAFRVENVCDDNNKVRFYTGFSTFSTLMACFNLLGPSDRLAYRSTAASSKSHKGRKRLLSPLNDFFLFLIRLHLGLFEQDLAYRFGISQSSVSRILLTWINFTYLQLKQIPLWPPKPLVFSNMPNIFKSKYSSTRVIIDATEVFVEQPKLPELQQLTFSNYKNHNTYEGLIGISPSGAITFISNLYPGSISDKELTRRSGILDLLE